MDRQVELTFSQCHLASFEFMIPGCKSDFYDGVKDWSELNTGKSSKGSYPFHFIDLVT